MMNMMMIRLIPKAQSVLSGIQRYLNVRRKMMWKLSLYVVLIIVYMLINLPPAEATETSIEGGRELGNICDSDLEYYWNVTVTNDDSPNSEYEVESSVIWGSDPSSYTFELSYQETETVAFTTSVSRRWPATVSNVFVGIDSSNGQGTSETWPLVIEACARLEMEAAKRYFEVRKDSPVQVLISISNFGNVDENISLEHNDLPAGWNISLIENISVKRGEEVLINFSVTPASIRTFQLIIQASSNTPGQNYTNTLISISSISLHKYYWMEIAIGVTLTVSVLTAAVYLYFRN